MGQYDGDTALEPHPDYPLVERFEYYDQYHLQHWLPFKQFSDGTSRPEGWSEIYFVCPWTEEGREDEKIQYYRDFDEKRADIPLRVVKRRVFTMDMVKEE